MLAKFGDQLLFPRQIVVMLIAIFSNLLYDSSQFHNAISIPFFLAIHNFLYIRVYAYQFMIYANKLCRNPTWNDLRRSLAMGMYEDLYTL